MKRFTLSLLALMVAVIGVAMPAMAADPGIPNSYKAESDPSGHRAEITKAISDQVAKLANDADSAGQSAARDWLQNEAALPNAKSTSTGYFFVYVDALNKALEPLVKDETKSARARLEAILIAGKVADVTETSQMLPTILLALGDKNEAMAIQGEKAAAQILPAVFKNTGATAAQDQKALLDGIVKGVAQHLTTSRAGLIAEDAYTALDPTLRAGIAVAPATTLQLADAMIHLQQTRLTIYKTGIPDSPVADTPGSLFLLDKQRWQLLSKSQQLAAMQNAVDLAWCAAQRAAQLAANTNQDLIHAINNIGQMIESIANNNVHNPALATVGQGMKSLSIGSSGTLVMETCKGLYAAAQASSPDFKDLKAPPELGPLPKTK